jgi:hypothetical protein
MLCDTELPSANVPAPIFHPNQYYLTARYLPGTERAGGGQAFVAKCSHRHVRFSM